MAASWRLFFAVGAEVAACFSLCEHVVFADMRPVVGLSGRFFPLSGERKTDGEEKNRKCLSSYNVMDKVIFLET